MKNISPLFAAVCITLLAVQAMGYDTDLPVEYAHNLYKLSDSNAPRHIALVDADKAPDGQKPIANGILFTYKNRKANTVSIAGDFSDWSPTAMKRSINGVWYYFLPSNETVSGNSGDYVRYKFWVDGILIPDPKNPFKEIDEAGSFISLNRAPKAYRSNHITFVVKDRNMVEFRFYSPNAKLISLVGDFNNWNPENDLMVKGSDEIWRLTKRLSQGTYRYLYMIDGIATLDTYNPITASTVNGDSCSLIKIP